MMSVRQFGRRVEAHLLFILALGIPCFLIGCGDADSGSKPTTISKEQQQQVQQHLGGYRQQLIDEAKKQAQAKAQEKAQAKANKAGQKSP
jgi:hypothetical protein